MRRSASLVLRPLRAVAFGLGLVLALVVGPVHAHEGHDHGEAEPGAILTEGWPRGSARSDTFEVVLVLVGDAALLYLDDAQTNDPVGGARVSVSGDGVPDQAWTESAPAVYAADLDLRPGRHALTVVVEAGEVVDLLPVMLEVPEVPGAPAATASRALPGVIAGGFALLLVLALLALRRRAAARKRLLVSFCLLLAGLAQAHGDGDHDHAHDHATEADAPAQRAARPGATGPREARGLPLEAPRRLGSSQVFVPKSVQRLWGLRTVPLRREPLAARAEWPGRVLADPAASSPIVAPEAGQALPGPGGFPRVGQRVRAGELLMRWQPRRGGLDRERLIAEQQRLQGLLEQAEARRARLGQLEGFVAGRERTDAAAAVDGLRAEIAALARGSVATPLIAPVDGVIVDQAADLGGSLEAGAALLRIADPDRLIIEALAPDASLRALAPAAEAMLADGSGARLALSLRDGGGAFRGQRVPWRFALLAPPAGLLVGQPVRVQVQAAVDAVGLTLPRDAVLAGEDAVPTAWVHVAPEVFEPRRLDVAPLDAGRVTLLRGAAVGERVVVRAAVLLGQVR